jgi:formylglycine-generating enzyme required for sulfatase activity
MKFILVPAGEFLMGSDESPDVLSKDYPQYERRRVQELWDEAPVHRVRITQSFYLSQFEVTVGQFRKFLEASGYITESVAD